MRKLLNTTALAATALLLLAGCSFQSSPTRFFQLPMDDSQMSSDAIAAEKRLIGVGPIEMPEALKRPEIVLQQSAAHLDVREFDQWAGSLEQSFTAVLAQQLRGQLQAERLVAYPWSNRLEPELEVAVQVHSFMANQNAEVTLICQWQIHDNQSRRAPTFGNETLKVKAQDISLESLLKAKSQAIEALADRIAKKFPESQ